VSLRRLKYFVKIVDVGSVTLASDVLHVAQPALSQHVATLEAEFSQQLLVRTPKGVTPTEAGKTLYRHAQSILKQMEQARVEVGSASAALKGKVSVGLAPGTAASSLALPLLRAVRSRHPEVVLHLNENFGTTLAEQISDGRMDMAVIYANKAVTGLSLLPLLHEELVLVTPPHQPFPNPQASLSEIAKLGLLMLRPNNVIRRLVDESFLRAECQPQAVAEIESIPTLVNAVTSGIGATILPLSAARLVGQECGAVLTCISNPMALVPLALCTSDRLAPSPSAMAVKSILTELAEDLAPTIGAQQSNEASELF
jgi:LysR family nitrogen assimilation transcriptional regulator